MFEGWCASGVLQSDISMEVSNGDPCGGKEERVLVLETTESPGHIGIRASSQKKRWWDQQPNQVHLYECRQQAGSQSQAFFPRAQCWISSVQQCLRQGDQVHPQWFGRAHRVG